MPAALVFEALLATRETALELSNSPTYDKTDRHYSTPIVIAIILCSILVCAIAAAMAFFCFSRADRRAKNVSASSDPSTLDRYTTHPRRLREFKDDQKRARAYSDSSSTFGTPSIRNTSPSFTQADIAPPPCSPLPLTRQISTPSIYSVTTTIRSPTPAAQGQSVRHLVESGYAPAPPTRIARPLYRRGAPTAPLPTVRPLRERSSVDVEQMLERTPDVRYSYAVTF